MDGAKLEALIQAGRRLLAVKLFLTSMHCLWMYDYLLTVGDEIKYAWSGKKSWIFALFIANRYTPVFYLIWINTTLFGYTKPATIWVPFFHTVTVTVLAQITFALRIYGVTGRNKFLGGLLSILIFAHLSFGFYFMIRIGTSPAQQLTGINLDAFKICNYKRWRLGELLFTNLMIAFDLLVFLIVLVTARKRGTNKLPGIPSILDAVRRDATLYFILMFACQVLLELFMVFAPMGIQLLPGVVNTIFVPIMVSRLMLSLKKAAVGSAATWSLATLTDFGRGTSLGTIHFASRAPGGSREALETPTLPNGGDIELEPMPRLPRDRGS